MLIKFFKTLVREHKAHFAYTRTVKELSQLSDKELNDIGISRADIHSVARYDRYERY